MLMIALKTVAGAGVIGAVAYMLLQVVHVFNTVAAALPQ
jgi:hypothetical protein